MPILSRKDLERISRRVLFRYLTLSDRKMDRIDPVDFAEKICGLHFAFADMSVTGSILGLTSYGHYGEARAAGQRWCPHCGA